MNGYIPEFRLAVEYAQTICQGIAEDDDPVTSYHFYPLPQGMDGERVAAFLLGILGDDVTVRIDHNGYCGEVTVDWAEVNRG